MRQNLFQKLKDVSSGSCFIEMMEGVSQQPRKEVQKNIPLSIAQSLQKFNLNNEISQQENILNFTNSLILSNNQINIVEESTRNQSDSNLWYEQRQYRLTASKFGRIIKRMETITKNNNETPHNLLEHLIQNKSVDTYATRHGIASEPHAKTAVLQILKQQGHKYFKASDSGTIIDEKYPFLSASPDQIICCKCCGKGLVEIKCPYSICDVAPSLENLKQIDKNTSQLKKNHDHYFQIQGQLGISKSSHCWYFVYTEHGHYIEKILFDEHFFLKMVETLNSFWLIYMAKELLYNVKNKFLNSSGNNIVNNTNNNEIIKISETVSSSKNDIQTSSINIKFPDTTVKRKAKCVNNNKKKIKATKQGFTPDPVYICPICQKNIPHIAENFEENSIGCEICNMWFHFKCVGITDEKMIPMESDSWFCKNCRDAFSKN